MLAYSKLLTWERTTLVWGFGDGMGQSASVWVTFDGNVSTHASLCKNLPRDSSVPCRLPHFPVVTSSELRKIGWGGVWVHSGCCNQVLQTRWLIDHRNSFLTVLKAGSLGSRWQCDRVLVTFFWWEPSTWFRASTFSLCLHMVEGVISFTFYLFCLCSILHYFHPLFTLGFLPTFCCSLICKLRLLIWDLSCFFFNASIYSYKFPP